LHVAEHSRDAIAARHAVSLMFFADLPYLGHADDVLSVWVKNWAWFVAAIR